MLTSEELEAIRGRADGSEPGPWRWCLDTPAILDRHHDVVVNCHGDTDEDFIANATFIAHARTDVPALLAMVDELKTINGGLRAWQDVARPKLEAIRLAAWDVVHTPTCSALDGRLVDDAEYRKLVEAFESEATS